MMTCPNPECRHRSKRKLRPLVITIAPTTSSFEIQNDETSEPNGTLNHSRRDQITSMFTTHPSLSFHFERPAFSQGVPSREIRSRVKLLTYANQAGLIPEVEWEKIAQALRVQAASFVSAASDGVASDKQSSECDLSRYQEKNRQKDVDKRNFKDCDKKSQGKHQVIDPFLYIATTNVLTTSPKIDEPITLNDRNTPDTKKKNHPPKFEIKSLVPISPNRRGNAEDISLPYSMELWRKAKSLNRDRSVLACTLAHLIAMKTLVGQEKMKRGDNHVDNIQNEGCVGYDFILEDNVRAFIGEGNDVRVDSTNAKSRGGENNMTDWTKWGCECANRIWDIIEASQGWEANKCVSNENKKKSYNYEEHSEDASNEKLADKNNVEMKNYLLTDAPTCHLRYYGWLGSLPNLTWLYEKHIPRTALSVAAKCKYGEEGGDTNHPTTENSGTDHVRIIFPFPTNDDLELDSIPTSKSSKRLQQQQQTTKETRSKTKKKSQSPHFETPGGSPVFGTFAYTVSAAAYHTFINQLQNDVGLLLWKGRRMRAYRAKPIDKILPRHVVSRFGRESVHLPKKVAFVRSPMVGSLLHPQWEEGFCQSTEWQHCLSSSKMNICKANSTTNNEDNGVKNNAISLCDTNGVRVWDHVWLTEEEKRIVRHRKRNGKWTRKEDIEKDDKKL